MLNNQRKYYTFNIFNVQTALNLRVRLHTRFMLHLMLILNHHNIVVVVYEHSCLLGKFVLIQTSCISHQP